jgi:phage FluMu gp28-like protein
MKALADTVRIVEWDELPASVREIPDGFDPLADGVLMRHQAEWLKLDVRIKVAEKGRRTGITFAEALDDTIVAASRKSAGGDNVYYIGDTKEKGREFIGYCARFARVIAAAQGQGVSEIEEFIFADQDERGETRDIAAYRIRFASGFWIVALSSRPANIRGLQGKVVIDEAAFHPDVQAVLDATTALLIWGGQIRIISSHNGRRNPFYQLIKDVHDGRYGDEARVYRVTFDDAVANGLYERMCLMTGQPATAEGKAQWYSGIRASYGPRKAAMREELDAVARDSGGVSIHGVWIERAMSEARPVLRLALDDDFAAQPEEERKAWGQAWIDKHLMPLLDTLDVGRTHVLGMDFARHRHFSVCCPLELGSTLQRRAPFVVEMANVPVRQQEQVLWALIDGLPRFGAAALDATGPGSILAEYTADHFGASSIHQVTLNRKWYGEWMPKMIQRFEDADYDLPRDADLEGDLRAIEELDGVPMVPSVQRKDLKDPDLYRHGDFAIALVLAEFSMLNRAASIDSRSTGRKRLGLMADDEPAGDGASRRRSIGFGAVAGHQDFGGYA